MEVAGALLERVGCALGLGPGARGLARTGTALAALLLVFALAYPEREARALRHVFGWGGALAFLLLWLRGVQQVVALEAQDRVPWRLLWGGFVVLALLAVAVRPFHSSDVYAYATVGRLQAHYHLDPYAHTAADVPDAEADPLLSSTWEDVPCTYGYLSALVCRAVATLGAGRLGLTIALFKLLGVALLALLARLTVDTVRRHGLGGGGLAAFTLLWSPYALLHFVSNAHNDLWMALAILLALRCALDGRWLPLVPLVVAGALFKHVALLLLPFAWLLLLRRHGLRRAALSTLLGLALAAAAAAPYAPHWHEVRWAQIGSILTTPWNSLQAALAYLQAQAASAWAPWRGSEAAFAATLRALVAAGFLGFCARRWLRAAARPGYEARALVADACTCLFVLLCVASAAWHPWYLGMFLPAVFLLPREHAVRQLTLWLAAFQMLAFTPLAKARVLEAVVMLALPMALWWRERRRAAPHGAASRPGADPPPDGPRTGTGRATTLP